MFPGSNFLNQDTLNLSVVDVHMTTKCIKDGLNDIIDIPLHL